MTHSLETLSDQDVQQWISQNVPLEDYRDKKVLLIVPDATRTAPLPLLFASLVEHLRPVATKIDFLIALGTHPPMTEEQINKLFGITAEQRAQEYADIGLFNHAWDDPEQLSTIGSLTPEETSEISDGLLSVEVPVQINKRIHDYDTLLVVGPVFPHEVVGFSGGNKYFFPGIAGPQLLNFFHWLGALITTVGIIGIKHTPVRKVVNRAAKMIPVERRCLSFVVAPDASLYGMFYGTPESAWEEASDLSSQVHIVRKPKPFDLVISCAPPMYDELWVAGKCMYKLEPVVAEGGELIIYAPHMHDISITHGKTIEKIGYHVRDYFTKQWDKFKDLPWGVLAHSTHVRGQGKFEDGVEKPRIKLTLATGLSPELCERINVSYRDPATIDLDSYANREEEGILLIPKAGEHLYRLENDI